MQAIEFEATINSNGDIHVPERYHTLYGQNARFVVLLSDVSRDASKTIDPMQYSNRIDWPVDSLDYQRQIRSEWE